MPMRRLRLFALMSLAVCIADVVPRAGQGTIEPPEVQVPEDYLQFCEASAWELNEEEQAVVDFLVQASPLELYNRLPRLRRRERFLLACADVPGTGLDWNEIRLKRDLAWAGLPRATGLLEALTDLAQDQRASPGLKGTALLKTAAHFEAFLGDIAGAPCTQPLVNAAKKLASSEDIRLRWGAYAVLSYSLPSSREAGAYIEALLAKEKNPYLKELFAEYASLGGHREALLAHAKIVAELYRRTQGLYEPAWAFCSRFLDGVQATHDLDYPTLIRFLEENLQQFEKVPSLSAKWRFHGELKPHTGLAPPPSEVGEEELEERYEWLRESKPGTRFCGISYFADDTPMNDPEAIDHLMAHLKRWRESEVRWRVEDYTMRSLRYIYEFTESDEVRTSARQAYETYRESLPEQERPDIERAWTKAGREIERVYRGNE